MATGSAWAEQSVEVTSSSSEINAPLQTISIKGTVIDANGNPIIGANVLEKGTTNLRFVAENLRFVAENKFNFVMN